ncbi:MAG: exodeoxyribonuclease VII large subunit [Lachnospiraceae bacterium]|nr:exodeoxyribonuclease VII large subunit [Lachnospiraceae bacterium]
MEVSAESRALSVSQINTYIKRLVTGDYYLRNVCVRGEASNVTYHPSGHVYFSLKDASSSIKCVIYRSQAAGLKFRIENGIEYIMTGRLDVYEPNGTYSIVVSSVKKAGLGNLHEMYEELKKKLGGEGLFDPAHKKPIPGYAKTVGVVTASTGAAIQDIINVTKRRNPYVQLILCPVLVQGTGAAASIAEGIAYMDAVGVDVMIVGRGGGSIEDLWAFNEEVVARAIYGCTTPVISAVGHEIDFTIADFVADLRAPTPSAAAELAVFSLRDAFIRLASCRDALNVSVQRTYKRYDSALNVYSQRLMGASPRGRLRLNLERLKRSEIRLSALMRQKISDRKHVLNVAENYLRVRTSKRLDDAKHRLDRDAELMKKRMGAKYDLYSHRLDRLCISLDALSPLKRLSGGYGFVTDEEGRPLTSVDMTDVGQMVDIRLRDGRLKAEVTQKNRSI